MSGVKHTPWEVGQHPAMSNGWIVRPILFGSNVRVLPESEGGHVIIRDERIARLIAAAPDFFDHAKSLVEAWDARTTGAQQIITGKSDRELQKQAMDAIDGLRAALARARGEQDGGGE